ncbi:MAG: glycosyltransferase family A protein, partial [Desulfobacula sp.]|nr:glycosyltransferase family A protein [Desulfobacula sp.]
MKHTRISAVIPAYNSANFLSFAINSILKQTQPVDEIIVVDDGSTDETAQVLKHFGNKIICIYQHNAGPSAARNKGIEYAKGDWVAFLDADDQWVSTKIEKQVRLIEKNPEIVLVAGDMAEIDASMKILVPSVLNKHGLRSIFLKNSNLSVLKAMDLLLEKNFIP